MWPAGTSNQLELQEIQWNQSLQLKHVSICSPDNSFDSKRLEQKDIESLFLPSFSLFCDEKEARGKFSLKNEEMIVVLDVSNLHEESDGEKEAKFVQKKRSDHNTIERFLAKLFRNATQGICKSLVPALGQNLCMCIDLFEEREQEAIFETFKASR